MEDFQIKHIDKNITELIELTKCNVLFLSILRQNNVISSIEQETLSTQNFVWHQKAQMLYDILKTRSSSYQILLDALKETNQSGAVKLLSQHNIISKQNAPFSINIKRPHRKGNNDTRIFSGTYSGRRVAVKVKNIMDPDSHSVSKEALFLRQLDSHPNIVRVFTEILEHTLSYIALEFCNCNLQEWINTQKDNLPKISKIEVLQQCTNGLEFIHANHIIHRDLCPENILISNCCLVKICDFSLSFQMFHSQTEIEASADSVGSEGWMAPEVYSFTDKNNVKLVTYAADVFSLGCVFHFVLTDGKHPFGDVLHRKSNIAKDEKFSQNFENIYCLLPSNCVDFLKNMIARNPDKRPKAVAILNAKCFWEFLDIVRDTWLVDNAENNHQILRHPFIRDVIYRDTTGLDRSLVTRLERYIVELVNEGKLCGKSTNSHGLTPGHVDQLVIKHQEIIATLEAYNLFDKNVKSYEQNMKSKLKSFGSMNDFTQEHNKLTGELCKTFREKLALLKKSIIHEFTQKLEMRLNEIGEYLLHQIETNCKVYVEDNYMGGLDKAYDMAKRELESNFPFQPKPGSRIHPDMLFYADKDLENVTKSIKEKLEHEFLMRFVYENDDLEIPALRNALHNKLQPLEYGLQRTNVKHRKRAENKAEETVKMLMEGYVAAMQRRIKRLKKIDAETLEEFSDVEVEKMKERFKEMNIGTYEFTQEWLGHIMEKVQEELKSMQLNLEATMAEAIKLVVGEEGRYEKDLSDKATEMDDNIGIISYHKDQVEAIIRRLKLNNPFPEYHPKYNQVKNTLVVKLQSLYEKVVINRVLPKYTIDTINTMEADLKQVLEENDFMERDEYESYINSTMIEIQQQFLNTVRNIGVDKVKIDEFMDIFHKNKIDVKKKTMLDNKERQKLACMEAEKLVENLTVMYASNLYQNTEEFNTVDELRAAHENIKENIVKDFLQKITTKNHKLIADSSQKLEHWADKMSKNIEVSFNMKIESENKALLGPLMEVKKFYQESMDTQYTNIKNGYFQPTEFEKMDKQTHKAAMNSLTADIPLNARQKGKLEKQLQKLFQKYEEKNEVIRHSYDSKDIAIGIDLGTTYCCVAVYHMGKVKILSNEVDSNTTPSYVCINADGKTTVGITAKEQAYRNPESTIFDAKRIIGRKIDDEKLQEDMKYWPFTVVEHEGKTNIKVHDNFYDPEDILSMILKHLKEEAEQFLKREIKKAVITVPVYFTDVQRQATMDAGELAGLNVVEILNEPTAAAVAYRHGLDMNMMRKPRKFLVYDLGGGTFDVAILEISEDKLDVLSIAGDSHLGGQDFDKNLMTYCAEEHKKVKVYGFDLLEGKDSTEKTTRDDVRRRLKRLQLFCENSKKGLSYSRSLDASTTIEIDEIKRGHDLNVKVTRRVFEERNQALFDKTITIVDEALKYANLRKDDIDDIVLVGGSTKIPKIQEMLAKHFNGRPINKQVNPDEAVAYGAALQAAILNARPAKR